MEQWSKIRRQVLVDGVSKREILEETGMHRKTLEKILANSAVVGYRQQVPRAKPRLGAFCARIEELVVQDKAFPEKQRHTAKRIFDRLVEEGYEGSYTQVREHVRQLRRTQREVFLPIEHRAGDAQCDFGKALVNVSGRLRKVKFFVMVLTHSDAMFVTAFDNERSECWWEGHKRAFEYFQGVPLRISYDNAKACVAKILLDGRRRQTKGFSELVSHYLFQPHFCQVGRGNEKGVVENLVGYCRRNWLVPVPQVDSLDELNQRLLEHCRKDLKRKLRGKQMSKEQLLLQDRAVLLALPATPFDACRKASCTASSTSMARFDSNDYSVPVRFAHHPVLIKGYVDRVEIYSGHELAAVHKRLWGSGEASLDPLHYLPLLQTKPGGLDHGRPFHGWQLPPCFGVLRTAQEERFGTAGTRDFIAVLQLLHKHPIAKLEQAIAKSLALGVVKADAIALFAADSPQAPAPLLDLSGREHLKHVVVAPARLDDYSTLVAGGVA